MRKRDVENVPIRSFDNSIDNEVQSKFEIGILNPDKDQGIKVEAHRHDYYHILYVKKGLGEHMIDFKSYEIKPNSIFFVSPGQVHSLEIDMDVEGYVISFDSDFYLLNNTVQKLLDYPFFHSLSNEPVIYLSENNTQIQHILAEIYDEHSSTEKGKKNMLRAFMEILLIRVSRIYNQPIINQTPAYLTAQLRKLESLIESNFKAYKLLKDYSDMMYISPKHLNSLCKKGLNKTVTNLIHERTIVEAKRLLLFTNNSISEIAFELGFTDKSYFMRFFKKHTTLTADSFRNQNT